MELRINMLPAIKSTRETPTWAAMRMSRSRRLRMGDDAVLALTAEESAERELSSAGARPKSTPATREMAKT
jgi:hypothetical protein